MLAIIKQLDKACALLASAKTLDEVLHVRDKGIALEAYARARERGSDAHASAYELCKYAERRLGELTSELPKASPGPMSCVAQTTQLPRRPKGEVLAEIQVTRQQAARAERLAEIPLADFNARLAHASELLRAGKRVPDLTAVTASPGHTSDEYGTPGKYVDPARELMGGIELDFASNAQAANIVRAERFFTKEDSALVETADWRCRSGWFQPPFSGELIKQFSKRLVREVAAGHVAEVVGLTNLDPSTVWWRDLVGISAGHVLVDHRIAFLLDGKPIKGNAFTQWFFYSGPRVEEFFDAYSVFGTPCRTALRSPEAS